MLLQKFQEMEQTAREQAADNAILDQLCKVLLTFQIFIIKIRLIFYNLHLVFASLRQGFAWLLFISVYKHTQMHPCCCKTIARKFCDYAGQHVCVNSRSPMI